MDLKIHPEPPRANKTMVEPLHPAIPIIDIGALFGGTDVQPTVEKIGEALSSIGMNFDFSSN